MRVVEFRLDRDLTGYQFVFWDENGEPWASRLMHAQDKDQTYKRLTEMSPPPKEVPGHFSN